MKRKTINTVLAKKFNQFLGSIKDQEVRKLVSKNTIITGGCIPSMFQGEQVNDYDMYFTNYETVVAVANYYIRSIPDATVDLNTPERVKIKVQSAGISDAGGIGNNYKYFEQDRDPNTTDAIKYVDKAMEQIEEGDKKPPYSTVFLSSNAITLSNSVQLILRFFGSPDEIHKNYDFLHCTGYWTSKDKKLVMPEGALEALFTKELRYVGSLYPVCSVIRLRKFIKRGYTINAGQMLKMCMQISALDLTDVGVLEDQLTGVDVAYFGEVIELLKEKVDGGKQIDSAYLIEVIDRIF
ncbi:MAG: hypothetical protein V3W03_01195 [Gammaproteobacteria bacterium]